MLFPLLAVEIVIALAFWRLFAPLPSLFITRLLHGQGDKKINAIFAEQCQTDLAPRYQLGKSTSDPVL